MKKTQIQPDRYIIYYNSKYYVVNQYTYNLLEMCERREDLKNCEKKEELKMQLTKLFNEMENIEYYDNNVELKVPLKLQWKMTRMCNLKCKHCYIGDNYEKELPNEELLEICEKIVQAGIMEVTITGGEVLTVDILDVIVKRLLQNDIKVNIFTNGILLYDFIKKIEKDIKNKEMLNFFVSVDGLEKTHNYIRGENTFKKTIKSIKYAVKKEFYITINVVLSKMNYEEVPQLYLYLKNKVKVQSVQISNLIVQGRANEDMKLSFEENEEFYEKLKNIHKNNKVKTNLMYAKMPKEGYKNADVFLVNEKEHYVGKENWKCCAGIGKATIDVNGDLYCCPFIKESLLGNIRQKDLKEVWSNVERYKFLKYLAENNNNSRVCIVAKNIEKGGEQCD